MAEVSFRRMTLDDLDAVLRVEFAAFTHPWTGGIFRDCINSGYECWVMLVGSQQVGHTVLMLGGDEGHLLNITVKPESQGRGLGQQLLGFIAARAAAAGVETLFLELRASNRAAFRLYERFGFNEVGRRKGYYPAVGGREDALVMACMLDPEDCPA
ncbi:MAG: ribosomal protein S18-alanine N-acetyltransferase [Halopseudomonas yangmingensis]|uniref:[Ribosomal protein bS18]-alanine N-acetyltransferase n=1 Tax=Halopseudomonas yangmingensis TaxID=1720063 RepID=A0A1I4R5L3_9GAMM|nr:ribosomal protein S18-alanine N-acetyltransferase [Halopseudomonas yangmingensis]SFM47551.1 ribosomal-protein-alanine N-acetyltransferase [Halopseudomonas yangmingensis]